MRSENVSQKIGRRNEMTAEEYCRRQGYEVFNLNKGCPDLLVAKDGKAQFFVEVKTLKHPVHRHQREYHRKLAELGFRTVIARISDDGKVNEEKLLKEL